MPHDDSGEEAVIIPETDVPLDALDLDELDDKISPLMETTNYGIDLYEKTLDFVSTKLNIIL